MAMVRENTKLGILMVFILFNMTDGDSASFVLINNFYNLHSFNVLVASSYAPPFCIRRMLIMGALTHFIYGRNKFEV